RITIPEELAGRDPQDSSVLRDYAHRVLDAAIQRGVEVLGLTPHDVRTGQETSAVWAIVEAWLGDEDAGGCAYRNRIYAVFPGFEPALNIGQRGLHLLFLFDPTIGKQRYLRLFDALMGGISPWRNNRLQMSNLDEKTILEVLDDFHMRENTLSASADHWEYLLLAPHAFAPNGLFGALKSQALEQFPSHRIAGIELGDNQMPEDASAKKDWLLPEMTRLRHAFYHASDAYGIEPNPDSDALYKVGSRVTLTKLAAPTVSALRQSFLASESRIRLAYRKTKSGELEPAPDLPTPCPVTRPWLRRVKIQGGTSFHRDQTFEFSPDLTCIIGGSMTGKSTLLDGLRMLVCGESGLPDIRTSMGAAVHSRARQRFLSGNPSIDLESPALDASLPVAERFDIRFFTQGELKTLSEDDDGIEHLLFHLVPGHSEVLLRQRDELRAQDEALSVNAARLARLQEQVSEAEQAFKRTEDARSAMQRFARAGTGALPPAQQDVARTRSFLSDVETWLTDARQLLVRLESLELPQVNATTVRGAFSGGDSTGSSTALLEQARMSAKNAVAAMDSLHGCAEAASTTARNSLAGLTAEVQKALVEAGGSTTDLNQFETFAKAAQHYDSFKAALDQKISDRDLALDMFAQLLERRSQLVASHRQHVRRVCDAVGARFGGRVVVQIQEQGRKKVLEDWVLGLRTRGVTQWWNSGGAEAATGTAIHDIATAAANGDGAKATDICAAIGMSDSVARSFLEQLASWARRLEARALRTPDRYQIQWVEDGEPKNLDDLSGGRKVAVLLSLLLESDDPMPLVVDQPEDELDNRFLNETIIPALHRLKGKRQVIFATHNANIVVNGDADQVIALEANAQHGRVYACGAIEDPVVRAAILRTLDGGETAFELRRAKYGF
ncbi:MAG: AAA family ATPase, partial [Gammaproteobacteria bacterium]|nr:AAA family ATPase [Gammaproteobacteria bacterium]